VIAPLPPSPPCFHPCPADACDATYAAAACGSVEAHGVAPSRIQRLMAKGDERAAQDRALEKLLGFQVWGHISYHAQVELREAYWHEDAVAARAALQQ
jgi:hypothetical protein